MLIDDGCRMLRSTEHPCDPGTGTTAALTDVLFAGRFDAVHAPWRALCDDESFQYPAAASPRERVNGSYRRLRRLNELLDSVEGLVDDVEGLAALHEWLCPVEGGLATVAGIHYNLFLGSLFDHDADDRRDLTPFLEMRKTGIFLCTEVGHGNDAARLETTATYEPSTGGFVLHTPTPAARKFMPNAGMAGGPKTGLVAARLIHTGRDLGVFLFLAPLTDVRGALPGVRIRRLPDKVGYAVDHCLTAFDHVRLPPHAFLAGDHGRLAADGAFTSSVDKHRLRFLRSIDRVTPGKLSMSAGAVGLTRTALTIAVRYAHTRQTSGLKGQSVFLFEHAGHRARLQDALADTYAMTLLHRTVLNQWVTGGAAGRADNDRLVAIAKAWITWAGRAVAIECRERCGAQGLLPFNGIAELPDYYPAGITAEGDNLVIWVKAAGELLGRELPAPAATAPDGRRLDDAEFLQALLGDLEYIWQQRARDRWLHAASTDPLDRWNAAAGPALEMTSAHAERQAGGSLLSAATRTCHVEARALLTCVHRLFALRRLARHTGDLLAEGRITADHVRALPDAIEAAMAELAPHALTLVDALAISQRWLDRHPIARTDFLAAFDSATRTESTTKGNTTMSELLDRKLKHFFTLMDRDGSATLELNDYLTTADSVANAFGLVAGSAEHDELRRSFTRFWEDIVKPMDTDGTGQVSFDEYLAAYNTGVVDNAQSYAQIKPISDAIIAIAGGPDGKITADNFALALSGYGVPQPECRAAFAALDKDGSGFLSQDELQEAIEEYFLGTDPDLPGNALFGTF